MISRPLTSRLFIKYCCSPERYKRRFMAISDSSIGRSPFSLLIVKVTSATLSAGRRSVPLKITSVFSAARRFFTLFSARTHFMASTTLLLPHPLGPKRAVIPSAKSICVRSAKDLKPNISRLFKNTETSSEFFFLYKEPRFALSYNYNEMNCL